MFRQIFPLVFFVLLGCSSGSKDKQQQVARPVASPYDNARALVRINTYNHYNQKMAEGYGIYVEKNKVVAPLSLVKGSFRVKVSPIGTDNFSDVEGFTAHSFDHDLIVMQCMERCKAPILLSKAHAPGDTLLSLFWNNRQLYFNKSTVGKPLPGDTLGRVAIAGKAAAGEALFTPTHAFAGMVQQVTMGDSVMTAILPAKAIAQMLTRQGELRSVYDLATKSNKTYPSYTTIKGFNIVTDRGNIAIRLHNDTPEYRDNFIRLVSDGFYDSLLIHRVIKGFLIQAGAADTKYAGKHDVVGWQGPGYTLPVVVKSHLFHKRGAVAAAKLPADRNPRNRCDGSQFYIVSGRVWTHAELDDLEKERKTKFTPAQRQAYTTIGGAPHLDGDYTVFGEVTAGMEVADNIARVETGTGDRPVNDIRIRTVKMMR